MTAAAANPTLDQKLKTDEDKAIYDWLSAFGALGEMNITLKRTSPKMFKGVQVRGTIDHYDEAVSDEEIKQTHGGGKFQLVVQQKKPNKNGNPTWVFVGARTFEIAGNPKLEPLMMNGEEEEEEDSSPVNDGPVGQAMNMMSAAAQRAEERAQRAEERGGNDTEMLSMMLKPLEAQIATLSSALAAKDSQLLDLMNKPPDNTVQERVLGLMETKEVGHGNAINAIRTAHDTELRQLRDFNREEITRRESRFERELDNRDAAHAREVATLRDAVSQSLESQKLGYDMRIDGLKESMKRLERDLGNAQTEVTTLRAIKEKGPLDQIQNLVNLKQGFEALVPTGSDEPTKTGWERAASMLMESPLAEGIASRIAGAAGEGPEEMVAVQGPNGQVRHVPASYIAQLQAQRAAEAAQQEAEGGEGVEGEPEDPALQLDPKDVARAVAFMESAYRNGTDPETFARSARNMTPASVLAYLKQVGVDPFLNNVAKLEDGSPLSTVEGRMFVRKVAKFLLEGTTEIEPEEQPQPQPTSPVEST